MQCVTMHGSYSDWMWVMGGERGMMVSWDCGSKFKVKLNS